jgi:hypothetical protein
VILVLAVEAVLANVRLALSLREMENTKSTQIPALAVVHAQAYVRQALSARANNPFYIQKSCHNTRYAFNVAVSLHMEPDKKVSQTFSLDAWQVEKAAVLHGSFFILTKWRDHLGTAHRQSDPRRKLRNQRQ